MRELSENSSQIIMEARFESIEPRNISSTREGQSSLSGSVINSICSSGKPQLQDECCLELFPISELCESQCDALEIEDVIFCGRGRSRSNSSVSLEDALVSSSVDSSDDSSSRVIRCGVSMPKLLLSSESPQHLSPVTPTFAPISHKIVDGCASPRNTFRRRHSSYQLGRKLPTPPLSPHTEVAKRINYYRQQAVKYSHWVSAPSSPSSKSGKELSPQPRGRSKTELYSTSFINRITETEVPIESTFTPPSRNRTNTMIEDELIVEFDGKITPLLSRESSDETSCESLSAESVVFEDYNKDALCEVRDSQKEKCWICKTGKRTCQGDYC